MKRLVGALLLISAGITVVFYGCKPSASTPAAPTNAAAAYPLLPKEAQPKLPTIKLYLGSKEMTAEMALTPLQEETGMMFRTNIGENEGMIFVLNPPQRASFWMMNCVIPLSAAYIDPDGTIVEIHDLEAHNTNAVLATSDNIQFVLETSQGWFKRNDVGVGAVVRTEKGTLRETFLR